MQDGGGGYVTDEELELCQTLEPATSGSSKRIADATFPGLGKKAKAFEAANAIEAAEAATSPSKEVLIGGDNNPSRR